MMKARAERCGKCIRGERQEEAWGGLQRKGGSGPNWAFYTVFYHFALVKILELLRIFPSYLLGITSEVSPDNKWCLILMP